MNQIHIRISEALYNEAKIASKQEFRTIPKQIAYWADVGRFLDNNHDKSVYDYKVENCKND